MNDVARYEFGPFQLDPVERTLTKEGRPVRLTPKDVGVLLALVERQGSLVDRERLFAQVWPGVVVEDCNLARHVATIRQALGDVAESPTFIETLPKRGYRFVAPVQRVTAPAAASAPIPPELPAEAEPAEVGPGPGDGAPAGVADRPPPANPDAGRPWRLAVVRWLGSGSALSRVLGAAGGLACISLAGWLSSSGPPPLPGPIRALAVLPISNLTGDAHHDHIGESIGAMLVTDLGRRPEIAVVSRGSSKRYDRSALSARDIGRELGVEGLLEAAVVRADDQVRVTAELVDVRTDRLVWAEVFEGDTSNLLELEDLIADAVLEALQLGPPPAFQPDVTRPPQQAARGQTCAGSASAATP